MKKSLSSASGRYGGLVQGRVLHPQGPFGPTTAPTWWNRKFTPRWIPGLKLWLMSDRGLYQDTAGLIAATGDGHQIGLWQDQSGNANHVTQATSTKRPTLRLGVQNGRPVLRFDGVDDLLSNFLTGLVSRAPVSFLGVVAPSSVAAGGSRVWSNPSLAFGRSGANGQLTTLGVQDYTTTANYWVVSTFTQFSYLFATDFSTAFWKNGSLSQTVTGASDAAGSPTSFGVGARLTPEEWWAGDVGELLIYTALSAADRQRLEAYLKARWNTP